MSGTSNAFLLWFLMAVHLRHAFPSWHEDKRFIIPHCFFASARSCLDSSGRHGTGWRFPALPNLTALPQVHATLGARHMGGRAGLLRGRRAHAVHTTPLAEGGQNINCFLSVSAAYQRDGDAYETIGGDALALGAVPRA